MEVFLRIQMPEGTASLDSNEGYQSIDAETLDYSVTGNKY